MLCYTSLTQTHISKWVLLGACCSKRRKLLFSVLAYRRSRRGGFSPEIRRPTTRLHACAPELDVFLLRKSPQRRSWGLAVPAGPTQNAHPYNPRAPLRYRELWVLQANPLKQASGLATLPFSFHWFYHIAIMYFIRNMSPILTGWVLCFINGRVRFKFL